MRFWKPQDSTPNATTRFVATLPKTPLHAHITHLHALMVHSRSDEYVMQAAEHSLRQIAVFTTPRYREPSDPA